MSETYKVGDLIEDCRYHPCIVYEVEDVDFGEGRGVHDHNLSVISLLDGSYCTCSVNHCGVVRITMEDVLYRKKNWKEFLAKMGWETSDA